MSVKPKSVVLLSGGLDSTVNFYMALKETQVVKTLTFHYGQRAAESEIKSAQKLSELNQVSHQVIELGWMKNLGQSSLTHEDRALPVANQVKIDDLSVSKKTAHAVWVPNRNGVFLNIAAAVAEGLKADLVIPGFNLEEAATFPDNSFEYLRSLRKAFYLSTANHVDVQCFTIQMTKPEILAKAIEFRVPLEHMWPCYKNEIKWCGECESCLRSKRAFIAHKLSLDLFLK